MTLVCYVVVLPAVLEWDDRRRARPRRRCRPREAEIPEHHSGRERRCRVGGLPGGDLACEQDVASVRDERREPGARERILADEEDADGGHERDLTGNDGHGRNPLIPSPSPARDQFPYPGTGERRG